MGSDRVQFMTRALKLVTVVSLVGSAVGCGDNGAPELEPDAGHPSDAAPAGASCTADVRLTCAVGCAVTVAVTYHCDPAAQINRWTLLGVTVDPDDGGNDGRRWETEYTCGATLPTMVVDVPCAAGVAIAGAVADHPTGGADIECLVGPMAACE